MSTHVQLIIMLCWSQESSWQLIVKPENWKCRKSKNIQFFPNHKMKFETLVTLTENTSGLPGVLITVDRFITHRQSCPVTRKHERCSLAKELVFFHSTKKLKGISKRCKTGGIVQYAANSCAGGQVESATCLTYLKIVISCFISWNNTILSTSFSNHIA